MTTRHLLLLNILQQINENYNSIIEHTSKFDKFADGLGNEMLYLVAHAEDKLTLQSALVDNTIEYIILSMHHSVREGGSLMSRLDTVDTNVILTLDNATLSKIVAELINIRQHA